MRPNDPELQDLLRNSVFEDHLQRNWERVWWNHRRNSPCDTSNGNKIQQFNRWKWTRNSRNGFEKGQRLLVWFLTKLSWIKSLVFHWFAWTYFVWCLQNWHFIFWIDFGLHFLPGPFWVLKQNPVIQEVEQILKLPSKNCLFKRLNYHKMWQQKRLVD